MSRAQLLWALATAALGYSFLQTLVLPALPVFAEDFGATGTQVAWVSSAFFLTSAVAIPIIGRLGDALGKARVLAASMGVLAAATLAAALAPSLETLIACRAVQGVGAAVFPLAFGIVRDREPPARVARGIGVVSSVIGLGSALGFVVGGLVLEVAGWRALFVAGFLPVLLAAVLVGRIPDDAPEQEGRPDWIGALLLCGGLASILLVVSEGGNWGWASPRSIGLVATGVGFLLAWGITARRTASPVVELDLVVRPSMALLNAGTFLVGYAMFAVFVTMPAFVAADPVVDGFGFAASPATVGIFFVPAALTVLAASLLTGTSSHVAPVALLRAGALVLAASLGALALWHDRALLVLGWMALTGVGCGICTAILGRMVVEAVPRRRSAVAGGVNSLMRIVGGALTGQLGAALIASTGVPTDRGYTTALAVAAAAGVGAAALTVPLGRVLRREAQAALGPPALGSG